MSAAGGPDRRSETLQAIIRNWVLPGAIIISDGWPPQTVENHGSQEESLRRALCG